jgi:hypothetical protein
MKNYSHNNLFWSFLLINSFELSIFSVLNRLIITYLINDFDAKILIIKNFCFVQTRDWLQLCSLCTLYGGPLLRGLNPQLGTLEATAWLRDWSIDSFLKLVQLNLII